MKKCAECGHPDIYSIVLNHVQSDYIMEPSHFKMVHRLDKNDLPVPICGYYCHKCKKLVSAIDKYDQIIVHSAYTCSPNTEKCYLVLIESSFARDAQVLQGDYFVMEKDNSDDHDSEWIDWNGDVTVGLFWGCCMNDAIIKAAEKERINPKKLTAYEVKPDKTKGEV